MAVVPTTTVSGIVQSTDANFNAIIPQMLNYAEFRIQRDIDFLQSIISSAYSVVSGTNTILILNSAYKTIESINILNPSTGAFISNLLPVSKEYVQNTYPDQLSTGIPQYFYILSNASSDQMYVTIAPNANANYSAQVTGTCYLPSLYTYSTSAGSAQTAVTYISAYLPDLLIMASMIYISAYQRNFGRQSDDPAMAQSYEAQYKALLAGATTTEARRKFQASAWSSSSVPLSATPTR